MNPWNRWSCDVGCTRGTSFQIRIHKPTRGGRGGGPLAAALLALALGCDSGTEPTGRRIPELALNTISIEATGAVEITAEAAASGGFRHVTSGGGSGVYVYADPNGLPLAIQLPGFPGPGSSSAGRWDPRVNYLHEGGVLTATPPAFERSYPILNVARKPSVSFGDFPAARLGVYASDSGAVTIDEIVIPGARDFTDFVPGGSVRGRMDFRAVADSLLVADGVAFQPDTVRVSVEFHVELENWRDGMGTILFATAEGPEVWTVVGASTEWLRGPDSTRQFIMGLGGASADGDDRLTVWFGTTMREPGSAALDALDPGDDVGPGGWPDHFIAGYVQDRDAEVRRVFASRSGTIRLENLVAHTHDRWGEVEGQVSVELSVQESDATSGMSAEVAFHLPLGFFVEFCVPPQTCPAGAVPSVGAAFSGADGSLVVTTPSLPR